MNSKGRTAAAVGAGMAGALVVGWVIVPASADSSPTPTSSSSAGSTGAPSTAKHKHDKGDLLGGRVLHGLLTVGLPGGKTELAETQRGEIMAVSPSSITIQSTDGFTMTYVVTAETKVREKGKPATIGDLSAHERAMVIGVKTGDTWTAKIIRCVRSAKTATSASGTTS